MSIWVGIDIGRVAVKVAVIRSAYRKTSLERLVVIPVDADSDPTLAIKAAMSEALAGKQTGDGLAVAIEGSRAAVRTMSLPASAQKQLGDILPFELESEVPFEMSDAVFDYRVLASKIDASVDSAQLPVLVAVVRTADVRARIDLVKAATGMEPERVGVGAFPLSNLTPYIPALTEDGPIALLDLGATESEVVILSSGEPVFARTLSYGTQGLPQGAARLAREVRTSIAAFRAGGGAPPVRVYLCGGGAFVSGAAGFLAGELELPIEELPAPTLDTATINPARLAELPRFAKAIGLALGLSGRGAGLNLRKGPLAYERGFAWVREKVPMLAGLATVIAVSFLFSAWAQLHGQARDREVLEAALGTVSKEVLGEETTSATRANELLGQLTSLNDEDPMPHADAFDVMVKLSEDIPQSMVHDVEELDVQKGHAVVHGIVGTIPDAQSIAGSMRSEKCFADVKITRTNQQPGTERQKYVMELDEKCPEDVKGTKKKKTDAEGSASAAASGTGGK